MLQQINVNNDQLNSHNVGLCILRLYTAMHRKKWYHESWYSTPYNTPILNKQQLRKDNDGSNFSTRVAHSVKFIITNTEHSFTST